MQKTASSWYGANSRPWTHHTAKEPDWTQWVLNVSSDRPDVFTSCDTLIVVDLEPDQDWSRPDGSFGSTYRRSSFLSSSEDKYCESPAPLTDPRAVHTPEQHEVLWLLTSGLFSTVSLRFDRSSIRRNDPVSIQSIFISSFLFHFLTQWRWWKNIQLTLCPWSFRPQLLGFLSENLLQPSGSSPVCSCSFLWL